MKNLKLLTIIIAVLVISCDNKEIPEPEPIPPAGAQDYKITLTKASDASTDWKLKIDAAVADRANVWIDLNNNGKKDNSEAITKFGEDAADVNIFSLGEFKTLVLHGKVTMLNCYNNQLTTVDVSKNTALKSLSCAENQLKAIDVSKNVDLVTLNCEDNYTITALDVSKNLALVELECGNNLLTSLDVSRNLALTYLACNSNALTNIDISKNTALKDFVCGINKLTTLNLTNNTALSILSCERNQFVALDLTKNTKLTYLSCSGNKISTLDLSKNKTLRELLCMNNQITALNLAETTAIVEVSIYFNKLSNANMSALLESLPNRTAVDKATIWTTIKGYEKYGDLWDEGNSLPPVGGAGTAKSKNWRVLFTPFEHSPWIAM